MKTLDEFKDNVDLYSADLSRWPDELVKPALAMMQQDNAAQEYFEAMLALDGTLRGYGPKDGDLGALEERIMAEIAKTPKAPAVVAAQASSESGYKGFNRAWLFAPGGGLLAAAVIGFILGIMPAEEKADTLLDPVYYTQDQIIGAEAPADSDMGGTF